MTLGLAVIVGTADAGMGELISWALRERRLAGRVQVCTDLDGLRRSLELAASGDAEYPAGLIIIDERLADREAVDAVTHLKSSEPYNLIPLVVLGGGGNSSQTVQLLQAGANSVVPKPEHPGKLEEIVRHLAVYWLMINATHHR